MTLRGVVRFYSNSRTNGHLDIQFLARDLIFGASRGPLLLSTAIAFIVQFTGQPTVLYYTSTFIKESGEISVSSTFC